LGLDEPVDWLVDVVFFFFFFLFACCNLNCAHQPHAWLDHVCHTTVSNNHTTNLFHHRQRLLRVTSWWWLLILRRIRLGHLQCCLVEAANASQQRSTPTTPSWASTGFRLWCLASRRCSRRRCGCGCGCGCWSRCGCWCTCWRRCRCRCCHRCWWQLGSFPRCLGLCLRLALLFLSCLLEAELFGQPTSSTARNVKERVTQTLAVALTSSIIDSGFFGSRRGGGFSSSGGFVFDTFSAVLLKPRIPANNAPRPPPRAGRAVAFAFGALRLAGAAGAGAGA